MGNDLATPWLLLSSKKFLNVYFKFLPNCFSVAYASVISTNSAHYTIPSWELKTNMALVKKTIPAAEIYPRVYEFARSR